MKYLIKIIFLCLLILNSACDAKGNNEPVALSIEGFNYTDRPISSFSINGTGGGNIMLSTPTNGGGKTVCCISIRPNTQLPITMNIEWTWDRVEDDTGKVLKAEEKRNFIAELKGPIPANPIQFEVHIYQDGHAEIAVSNTYSQPRMKLTRKSPLRRE
jgi:hypothetical protein